MGFFDLIREQRTGEPNLKKAAKAMNFLGWGCLVGGLWNFLLPQVAPFKETGFHLPTYYPLLALIAFSMIGALFLLSARGIREMKSWGKKAGQAAITLLLAAIVLFPVLVMPDFVRLPPGDGPFRIVFYVFLAMAMAQFVLPAYFGFRYLGRLPARDDPYSTINYNPGEISRTLADRMAEGATTARGETRYKDSPFPFGIMGTFPLIIAVPLLTMFLGERFVGPEGIALMFPVMFGFIFLGPAIFNYLSSPFQENRKLVTAYTGGGSIYLFHGSWPFFRLMVYDDALEVRVMFHRFLIPYEKMEDIPGKIGFFSTGILIKSDLPDVPSSIRFSGFGMKKIAQAVNAARSAYMATVHGRKNP
jgi:hypothetical protein